MKTKTLFTSCGTLLLALFWSSCVWAQIQIGTDIDGEAAINFSGSSVSLDGHRVAIGAPTNDDAGYRAGHVRIYEWNGANWTQMGADIDGEAASDESGHVVSLDGNRVAIGAPLNAGNGSGSGQVRIYEWNGTTWTQMGADIDGQ